MKVERYKIIPIKKVFAIGGATGRHAGQYTYDHRTKRITKRGRKLTPEFELKLKEAIKLEAAK
jgi:hypothetical protein